MQALAPPTTDERAAEAPMETSAGAVGIAGASVEERPPAVVTGTEGDPDRAGQDITSPPGVTEQEQHVLDLIAFMLEQNQRVRDTQREMEVSLQALVRALLARQAGQGDSVEVMAAAVAAAHKASEACNMASAAAAAATTAATMTISSITKDTGGS
eukprot:jgi/Mesvir1/16006/Mv08306-RA.1